MDPVAAWRIACVFILGSFSFLLFSATAVGAPLPDIARSQQNTLVVGVYENAPKVFTGESGKPAGIFIDIIEHIAEREGWTLRYVSGTWAEGLDRLARGEIDLMPDVAYTEDRGERYAFHEVAVLSSWFQVYARAGSGIKSILDLHGKRVAVLEGSVQQEAFERLAGGFGFSATLVSFPDYQRAFEAVARGAADAAVSNRFYGLTHAKRFGLEDTAVMFYPTNLFFAASKGGPRSVLEALDRHLSTLKGDPHSLYYRTLKQWTADEVPFRVPVWLQILGLVLGVALVTSLAGSLVLKHQVTARTGELTRLNQEMEQRIVERTAELASAMERAEAADRLKSAFLANMSHELRTPLNSIIGFTGIILQELAGPLNPEQRKQLGMVRESARHLLALINDVLDISKIEAGQLEVAREMVDVRASVEKVVGLVRPLAEKRGLVVRVTLAPEVGTVAGDQRRVEQVLLNLLNNAIKFTERGEVALQGDVVPGGVRSDGKTGGAAPDGAGGAAEPAAAATGCPMLRLAVRDTGIGIKPEDLASLFRPFRQIDSGLTRQHDGTGLGLAICRRLVELMGGEIRAESEWGKGSLFTCMLPITTPEQP
jgi:signal transduction histidine kinase